MTTRHVYCLFARLFCNTSKHDVLSLTNILSVGMVVTVELIRALCHNDSLGGGLQVHRAGESILPLKHGLRSVRVLTNSTNQYEWWDGGRTGASQ